MSDRRRIFFVTVVLCITTLQILTYSYISSFFRVLCLNPFVNPSNSSNAALIPLMLNHSTANTSNISSSLLSSSSLSWMVDTERERPWNRKICYFEYDALPIGLGITYEVSVLYHVGMLANWRSIMLDQLHTMEICGLGYITSDLTISFSNPSTNTTQEGTIETLKEVLYQFPFTKRENRSNNTMNVTFINATKAWPYERPIMEHIGTLCRRHHNASIQSSELNKTKIVFYFHTKGVSKYIEENVTKENEKAYIDKYELYDKMFLWRKQMEWFLIEKPSLCIREFLLHQETKACGAHLKHYPKTHYSGNFWASTCHHIKDLPIGVEWPLFEKRFLQYISAELWIGNYTNRQPQYFLNFLLRNYPELIRQFEKYDWILSNKEFLQSDNSSILQNQFKDYFPHQTDLWLDYATGLKDLRQRNWHQ